MQKIPKIPTQDPTECCTQQRGESASSLAERAADEALAGNHARAEELYLKAAAKASASGGAHMLKLARQWDRDAARQNRLVKIAGGRS